jgi:hypothetical protein
MKLFVIYICIKIRDNETNGRFDNIIIMHINEVIFLIRIVGGGVHLGPLGTAASDWPIVLAPGDYDDGELFGMKISRGNRSTRKKRTPAPPCQPKKSHLARPGLEPEPPRWEASD